MKNWLEVYERELSELVEEYTDLNWCEPTEGEQVQLEARAREFANAALRGPDVALGPHDYGCAVAS